MFSLDHSQYLYRKIIPYLLSHSTKSYCHKEGLFPLVQWGRQIVANIQIEVCDVYSRTNFFLLT